MDTLEWQGEARLVAYVDLIVYSIALFFVISFAILVLGCPAFAKEISTSGVKRYQGQITFRGFVWMVAVFAALFTFIQSWAAVKLLDATDGGRELHEALDNAATWRKVTVVFLIFQVCGLFMMRSYISGTIGIVIRGIFLFVVHKFTSEINSRLTTSSVPGLTMDSDHWEL